MAIPTLDFRNRLSNWLHDHDCSIMAFLTVTGLGISQTRLTSALSGSRRLDTEDEIRLQYALTDLQAFVSALEPVPVNFRDAEVLRKLVDDYRKGNLRISVEYEQ